MLADALRQVPLFAGLDDGELASVVGLAMVREYPAGAVLFTTGDPPGAFFVIAGGRVEIQIPAEADQAARSVSLGQGKFFGEMGVIRGTPRMATAVVEEAAELLTIEAEDFDRLMAVDEAISEKVMAAYLARLREIEEGAEQKREVRVLGFLGAGAGSGSSFVAANVAAKVRDLTRGSVLVLDLDVDGPSQQLYHGYSKPHGGLAGALAAPQLSPDAIRGAARRIGGGLELLGGPGHPDQERLVPERVAELIRAAARAYDYVVIDAPGQRLPLAAAALAASDAAHLVVSPSPVSLARARSLMERLREEAPGLRLVFDQQRAGHGLDLETVEAELEMKCVGAVDYADHPALDAVTAGVPLVKRSPRSAPSVQLTRLARQALCLSTEDAGSPWMSLLGLFR